MSDDPNAVSNYAMRGDDLRRIEALALSIIAPTVKFRPPMLEMQSEVITANANAARKILDLIPTSARNLEPGMPAPRPL